MTLNHRDIQTTLFKEKRVYEELPHRYLFACHQALKEYDQALEYAMKASQMMPRDEWLKDKVRELKIKSGKVIECYRQGAIGDCLMTTPAVHALREKYPDHLIRYVTHEKSRDILEGNSDIDEILTEPKNEGKKVFFCYPDKQSTLRDEGYPNKPLSRHLIQIFNECAGVDQADHTMHCHLSQEELDFGLDLQKELGEYATLHTQAGWSPYKEWADEKWAQIVAFLRKDHNIPVILIGGTPNQTIDWVAKDLRGKTTIKQAISAIKHAKIHLGIDSFSNHASDAVGTRSIILFGSTSPKGSGYEQNKNLWKDLDCSPCYREYEWAKEPREKCPYDKRCMNSITVEDVIEAIKSILG